MSEVLRCLGCRLVIGGDGEEAACKKDYHPIINIYDLCVFGYGITPEQEQVTWKIQQTETPPAPDEQA